MMTHRSLELIAAADAILYDRLIPPGALDGARGDAQLIYVGKQPGGHSMSQQDINARLVELGKTARTVVRLKGGDPNDPAQVGQTVAARLRAVGADDLLRQAELAAP